MTLISDLEARQIAPLREKVDAILGGCEVGNGPREWQQSERVDHAISGTMGRVDETADARIGAGQGGSAVGVVRGVQAIFASLIRTDGHEPPTPAAGRF